MPHRRPNKKIDSLAHLKHDTKLAEWGREQIRSEFLGEELAADRRVKEENSWPINDYVLGAALFLIGAIVLIAIALATGLVKP